jgi:hypothetical protein
MRRAGVALVLLMLLPALVAPVAGQQAGNSSSSGVPTVDSEAVEVSVGAGVSVVDAEVVQEIDGGARIELVIESDESRSIRVPQVYRAMQSGGQMTYARHSLADGRTEIEVRGFAYNSGTSRGKVYVAQLVRGGDTYFVLVDTEGGMGGPPPTEDTVAWGAGIGAAAAFGIGLAYVKREFAGEEQEREL